MYKVMLLFFCRVGKSQAKENNFQTEVISPSSVTKCAVPQMAQLIAGSGFESRQLAALIPYYLFIDGRQLET